MGENENKRSFVIDKGIQHFDVSAGSEMPPGILGAPMTLAPHKQDRGVGDDRISPGVRAGLSKLSGDQRQRILDVVKRRDWRSRCG